MSAPTRACRAAIRPGRRRSRAAPRTSRARSISSGRTTCSRVRQPVRRARRRLQLQVAVPGRHRGRGRRVVCRRAGRRRRHLQRRGRTVRHRARAHRLCPRTTGSITRPAGSPGPTTSSTARNHRGLGRRAAGRNRRGRIRRADRMDGRGRHRGARRARLDRQGRVSLLPVRQHQRRVSAWRACHVRPLHAPGPGRLELHARRRPDSPMARRWASPRSKSTTGSCTARPPMSASMRRHSTRRTAAPTASRPMPAARPGMPRSMSVAGCGKARSCGSSRKSTRASGSATRSALRASPEVKPTRSASPIRICGYPARSSGRPSISAARPNNWSPASASSVARRPPTGWSSRSENSRVPDVFDTITYAHDPRNDFLNWSLVDAGTFDYAADAWGFTYGAAVEWYQGNWTGARRPVRSVDRAQQHRARPSLRPVPDRLRARTSP